MAKKLTVTALKAYLKQQSPETLASEIVELFSKFKEVKGYYIFKLNPAQSEEILKKYKKIVEDEFFPARGFGKLRASVVKKAISDYKKIGNDTYGLIDLMLFYVEQGTLFIKTYGDIDEVFYGSMEGVFAKALTLIFRSDLENEFYDRCYRIVENSTSTGYGFHDTLSECYEEYYGEWEI
jgi:hypothetical protein